MNRRYNILVCFLFFVCAFVGAWQMVEAGHKEINQVRHKYLKFTVPKAKEVTMRLEDLYPYKETEKSLLEDGALPSDMVVEKGSFYFCDAKIGKDASFTSSNPCVARVTEDGELRAKQYGSTVICMRHEGKRSYCKLFVLPKEKKDRYVIRTFSDFRCCVDTKLWREMQKYRLEYHRVAKLSDVGQENALGAYAFGDGEIRVLRQSADYKVSLHELGHFVDDIALGGLDFDKYSDTVEFQKLYRLYAKEFRGRYDDAYIRSKSSEYFAESFMLYLTNPYGMKKDLPGTYAWVHRFMYKMGYER